MQLIEGIAAVAGVSRNGTIYTPKELAKLHSKKVPILWRHQGSPTFVGEKIAESYIIGEATLFWDARAEKLRYRGKVKESYVRPIQQMSDPKVSISAFYNPFCNQPIAFDMTIDELSIVAFAGIPEASLKLVESYTFNPYADLDLASRMKLEQAMRRVA